MRILRTAVRAGVSFSAAAALYAAFSALPSFPGFPHGSPQALAHARGADRGLRIVSSVQLPPEAVQKAARDGRAAYTSALAPYARITPDAAKAAAQRFVPGSLCEDVSLRALRSSLVYLALLQKGERRSVVIVDAGDGRVLAARHLKPAQPGRPSL